jgi:hypothetical protein
MRPMGWQVSWLADHRSLPPSRAVACGQTSVASGKCSPLTVAGAAVGLHCSARARDAYHIPSSLNGNPWKPQRKARALYCRRRDDALPWRGCQVLVQAWGWRVKREAGASAALPLNPGTAPATVSESRRKPKSLRPRTAWEDLRRPQAFASPETGLESSSGYLRGGRIGPCCVETAFPCRRARLRRALQNPVLSPIPVRLQRLAGIRSGCGGCAR